MKNLIIICIAFLFNFISFGGASSLQSSLNDDQGLGTGSLAIIYASLIVSAMFTPSVCKQKFCWCFFQNLSVVSPLLCLFVTAEYQ